MERKRTRRVWKIDEAFFNAIKGTKGYGRNVDFAKAFRVSVATIQKVYGAKSWLDFEKTNAELRKEKGQPSQLPLVNISEEAKTTMRRYDNIVERKAPSAALVAVSALTRRIEKLEKKIDNLAFGVVKEPEFKLEPEEETERPRRKRIFGGKK